MSREQPGAQWGPWTAQPQSSGLHATSVSGAHLGPSYSPSSSSPDASYLPSPWAQPIEGLEAIARFWETERDGADEKFTMSSDVVAMDGGTAVIRVLVEYGADGNKPWRDLWLLRFAADGRCSSFEEWPFAPDQPDGH